MKGAVSNLGIATVIVLLCVILLLVFQGDLAMTSQLPVLAVGSALMASETVKWYRGGVDPLDSGALVGGVSVLFLLISPALQLAWDYWPFLPSLAGNEFWIFLWALFNLFGVALYYFVLNGSRAAKSVWKPKKIWLIDAKRFYVWVPISLLLCFAAQIYVYLSFGGLSGFVETFTQRQMDGVQEEDPFEGMGFIMLIAESFKMLFAIYVINLLKDKSWARKRIVFVLLMAGFFVIFLFFGGLRGSRSSTLFAVFFAAGMYHFLIRKLSAKTLVGGILAASLFLTTYYWYKIAGLEGLAAITDSSARTDFHSARQDAMKYIVARDLGRMDMQVLAMREMSSEDGPDYALGRTYVNGVFSIVPKQLVPYKPDQITKEKTEILYGKGSYDPSGARQTTLVLGQFGELFVNFSYFGAIAYYFLLAMLVLLVRRLTNGLARNDSRLFLLPVVCLLPALLMITDFNVIVQQLFRYTLLPVIVLLAVSRRVVYR